MLTDNLAMESILKHKKAFIWGFIFGAIVAPALSLLGLIAPVFDRIRPMLIGSMDVVSRYFPDVQPGPFSFAVSALKWILMLSVNGLIFSLIIGFIYMVIYLLQRIKSDY